MFHIDGLKIRDEYNRQRIFKGINGVYKQNKFKPKEIKETRNDIEKHIAMMKKNGINILRMGFTWSNFQPDEEGVFDDELIKVLKEYVTRLEEEGIFVILDGHQDLFYANKKIGDGAPKWITEGHYEESKPMFVWAEGYFYMKDIQRAFNDFWNNERQMQDRYVQFWHKVTEEFKDFKNIIAYDYFNEPMIHDNSNKCFCELVDGALEHGLGIKGFNAHRFYENGDEKKGFMNMAKAIYKEVKTLSNLKKLLAELDNYDNFAKAVKGLEQYVVPFNTEKFEPFFNKMVTECGDEEHFNLYEHSYYSNLGIPFEITPPKNSIYSPHAYDIFIDSPFYNKFSSNERIHFIIDGIKKNQDAMQVPVIMGEWGGCCNMGHKWLEHIDYIYNLIEDNQWSNLYWSYMHEDKQVVHLMNRPYPVAVCGDIISYHTDSKARTFTLKYNQPAEFENMDVETEVYDPNRGIVKFKGQTGENVIEFNY